MAKASGLSTEELQQLISLCNQAKAFSYSPYSKFRVGASLLTTDGIYYKGCNVENASYGLTNCAERTTIFKAVSEGHQTFKALALTSDMVKEFCTPCGACRQVMIEFGLDYEVLFVKPDGSYRVTTVTELLPDAFVPDHLKKKTVQSLL